MDKYYGKREIGDESRDSSSSEVEKPCPTSFSMCGDSNKHRSGVGCHDPTENDRKLENITNKVNVTVQTELNVRSSSSPTSSDSLKTKNSRNKRYFTKLREMKKEIAESKLDNQQYPNFYDDRPYGSVYIQGYAFRGLLDSGANVSVLGRGAEDFLQKTGLFLHSFPNSHVSTASGKKERILGYVSVNVKYGNKIRRLVLYVVPSLQQSLYLGIDFWKRFGLQPVMINEITTETKNEVDPNIHEMTAEQRKKLNEVIELFPDSSKLGLGKTNLMVHKIDVGDAEPKNNDTLQYLRLCKKISMVKSKGCCR